MQTFPFFYGICWTTPPSSPKERPSHLPPNAAPAQIPLPPSSVPLMTRKTPAPLALHGTPPSQAAPQHPPLLINIHLGSPILVRPPATAKNDSQFKKSQPLCLLKSDQCAIFFYNPQKSLLSLSFPNIFCFFVSRSPFFGKEF